MATLANRSRLLSSRLQRTYRLEMGGKTLFGLLGLATLTGIVLFYMGVVAGMGMRQPAAERPSTAASGPATGQDTAQQEGAGQDDASEMAFNRSLLAEEPMVEDLWQDQANTSRQTQEILARAQRELKVEQVPAPSVSDPDQPSRPEASAPAAGPSQEAAGTGQESPPKSRNAIPRGPAEAGSQAAAPEPAASASEAGPQEGEYTVQVFSSHSRDNAQKLIERLRGMGFSAYLNQFQDADRNTWYRVRVGRTSQTGAERLKQQLKDKANLKAPRIMEL